MNMTKIDYQKAINEELNQGYVRRDVYFRLMDQGWNVPPTFEQFDKQMDEMGFGKRGQTIYCDRCCRDDLPAEGSVVENDNVICIYCKFKEIG